MSTTSTKTRAEIVSLSELTDEDQAIEAVASGNGKSKDSNFSKRKYSSVRGNKGSPATVRPYKKKVNTEQSNRDKLQNRTGKRSPPFIKVSENKKKYVDCPALAKYFRQTQHMISVRDNGRSGVQRFVYENGCYRPYADDMIRGMIKQCIKKHDESLIRTRDINEVFQLLITDLDHISNDELNADENLINFSNGLLKIDSLTLKPHDPEVLSTIQLPCKWKGVETPTPVFDDFLDRLTNKKDGVKELLLEFMGVALSNVKGHRMKKALFLAGPGDSGKSQLKSLTERLLGKGNYAAIDLREIEARFGTSNLYGKRLVGSSDMSSFTIDELKTFKKCTGGDSLFAEFKGKDGFEFVFNGLLWFCMNKPPKFGGDDGDWVYNRIMLVPCTNVIPPDEQDKRLLDKLYKERAGIIYRAVMALKRVIDNGYRFKEPETVINAREMYKVANNSALAFFEKCMIERTEKKITDNVTTGVVYKIYKLWCRDNCNGRSKTQSEFRAAIANHLGCKYSSLIVRRGKGGSFYKDYALSDEVISDYQNNLG